MNRTRSQEALTSLCAHLIAVRATIDRFVASLADAGSADARVAEAFEEALVCLEDAASRVLPSAVDGTPATGCVEQEARMFRALVDASPNGVFLRSLPGIRPPIAFANPALRRMLGGGVSEDAYPEYPVLDVAPDDLERMLAGDVEFIRSQAELAGPLAPFPATISSFLIPDGAGAPWLVATTVIDTTEAQRVSEELRRQAELIARQQAESLCAKDRTLAELAAPLIPVAERVLVLPLIGALDRTRLDVAAQALLEGIGRHRAHTAIVDLTGVHRFDAGEIGSAWTALVGGARLLGARVVLSGITPELAAALAELPTASLVASHGTLLRAIKTTARGG